ncbi:MAG: carboxymuconolactone decarboxylase family protein [bacterium]|nr:carboxymuconolactone decarboxylase family protein [bacterium]MBU1918973.1 carboxymuconolactone decarboxylase family protein [bacterium]
MNTKTAVTEILTHEEITALREGYDRDVMNAIIKQAITEPYPKAKGWTNFVMDDLYGNDMLSPKEREIAVMSHLAARGEFPTLAVHIYWGLMEGLEPEDIANILVIAGNYSGISNYIQGIKTMQKTLNMLKDLTTDAKEALLLQKVLPELLALFSN